MTYKEPRCTCLVGNQWEYGQCDYCTNDEPEPITDDDDEEQDPSDKYDQTTPNRYD